MNISSVLFCCNDNSVRSPMAEGIFKNLVGKKIFVQSAGVFDTLEIDGFTVKVCDEIDVKLNKHRVRSLKEMEKEGGYVGSFDLIIPLTKEALEEAFKYSTYSAVIAYRQEKYLLSGLLYCWPLSELWKGHTKHFPQVHQACQIKSVLTQ